MNFFSQLNIKPPALDFTGDKIKLHRVLNQTIKVIRYKIEASKFTDKGNGLRLTMQIEFNQAQYIIFSGSTTLMEMIKQVPEDKFPFTTKIEMQNDRPIFT